MTERKAQKVLRFHLLMCEVPQTNFKMVISAFPLAYTIAHDGTGQVAGKARRAHCRFVRCAATAALPFSARPSSRHFRRSPCVRSHYGANLAVRSPGLAAH